MKDTILAERLHLEDARQQEIYDRSVAEIGASRRRVAGEPLALVYVATELGQMAMWHRAGHVAKLFLIVMAGVIPNLLMLTAIL